MRGDHAAAGQRGGEHRRRFDLVGGANKSVNRIRQVVERSIAHIKAPENLSRTAYRRLLGTFEQTITAALALYVFKTTPE